MDIVQDKLQKIFGHNEFQQGQEAIIRDVIKGNDVLGVLPTGSGKSLCYQLPATILPGLTVVISPLISLMIDQVRQIKAFYFKEVGAMHSFQSMKERNNMLTNLFKYRLLFLSPELLQQPEIMQRFKQVDVSLICIDEAHCISQWGYDFRPDYLRIRTVIEALGRPRVLALTGTATENIQKDILENLQCSNMKLHIYSMEKKNITFVVEKLTCNEQEKMAKLSAYVEKLEKPALIYFSSRNKAEEMTLYLSQVTNTGKIAYYHAGMEAEDRLKVQEQFIHDQLDVICCTSAFGMGINKANIRTVIHYHPPAQLESFLQEIGRAGRDGKDALSLLLYRESDINVPLSMIENELPERQELAFVFQRLRAMQSEGKSLPTTQESLVQLFQLSETKWRLLQYQLELHHIIKDEICAYDQEIWRAAFETINTFCLDRKRYKRRKMDEMIRWLQSETCLRRNLYKLFQENIAPKIDKCCSNCGWHESDFEHVDSSSDMEKATTWRANLSRILLIEENDYAESK